MHSIGRFVFQGYMRLLSVIHPYRLRNHLRSLRQILRTVQKELALEDAIDSLGQSILVAVVVICHRTDQTMSAMDFLVIRRAILSAPVTAPGNRVRDLGFVQGEPYHSDFIR